MNKPITSRVRQATNGNRGVQEPLLDVGAAGVRGGAATRKQPSPLKKVDIKGEKSYGPGLNNMFDSDAALKLPSMPTFEPYSATNTIANVADDTKNVETKKDAATKKDSKNESLAEGATKVAGDSKSIPKATDAKTEGPPKSDIKRSGRTIGDAFQDNMVARIDKAGELGRARRDARRDKKAISVRNKQNKAIAIPTKTGSVKVEGAQLKNINLSNPSSSATAGRTNGVTNERFNDEMLTQANAREDKMLDDLEGRMSSSLGAPVQMRKNANIGMKSKSPMKKGYFKGM